MKSKLLTLIDRCNPLVIALLKSPFHWLLSYGLMAITFTGRNSGKQFTTPVGYHRFDDAIIVMVSAAYRRQWWRNYRELGVIDICLKGQWICTTAEVLAPRSHELKQRAEACFQRARFIPRIFGVDYDAVQGLSETQIDALANYAVIVKIKLGE